jgi:hypothetical protein
MQVRRITINGRQFVLQNPESASRMLTEIEDAARKGPAWVTIPVREAHPPRVLVTAAVDCFLEVLEIPDEDPETEGAALAFGLAWPDIDL